MLQIRNLNITHKKDLRIILQDFSCVFNDGDKVVIIGEEGNGKSTLLKWMYHPKLIEEYAEATGDRIVNMQNIAYLPQELPKEEEQKSIYEFFMEESGFCETTPKELGRIANNFSIPYDFFFGEQKMRTLSGGEKVKAQMMRLLMSNPCVLLLDEPSNDIDINTLEWLEDMIINWPYIVIFISHDETLIEHTANRVIHMEMLRKKAVCRCTVANMPYMQYIQKRASLFEKQEQQALSDIKEKKIREEKLHRIEQSLSYKLDHISKAERDAPGRLMKKKMKALKSMEHRFERENENMTPLPETETIISFKFNSKRGAISPEKVVMDFSMDKLWTPDNVRVLTKDVHIFIRGSKKICIVGKNGVGKTTLLKKIVESLVKRTDIHVEYMPQNYEELLNTEITPVDYLDTIGNKEERTKVRTFLGSLKFTTDEMNHSISELSGGQKAKVLLLKMSMSGADVLILDEPTRNFSPMSGAVIRRMLREFQGAIVSVSHDRKYIEEVCDMVYCMTELGLKQEK